MADHDRERHSHQDHPRARVRIASYASQADVERLAAAVEELGIHVSIIERALDATMEQVEDVTDAIVGQLQGGDLSDGAQTIVDEEQERYEDDGSMETEETVEEEAARLRAEALEAAERANESAPAEPQGFNDLSEADIARMEAEGGR